VGSQDGFDPFEPELSTSPVLDLGEAVGHQGDGVALPDHHRRLGIGLAGEDPEGFVWCEGIRSACGW
jgi:hypothetical protein